MAGLKCLDYTFKCLVLCFYTPNKLNIYFLKKNVSAVYPFLNKYLCLDRLAGGGRQNPFTKVTAGESPEKDLPPGTWHMAG